MAYPIIQRGTSATLNALGDYTAAGGDPIGTRTWTIQDGTGTVVGTSAAPNGWNLTLTGTQMTVSVAADAPSPVYFAAYYLVSGNTYKYLYFAATGSPPATPTPPPKPNLAATAVLVGNVPTNRLTIS